jgi:hypothetical protein
MTTKTDQIEAAARDMRLADHAYQLALANGDPQKIKGALIFWRACMADYDEVKRKEFRSRRRKASRIREPEKSP